MIETRVAEYGRELTAVSGGEPLGVTGGAALGAGFDAVWLEDVQAAAKSARHRASTRRSFMLPTVEEGTRSDKSAQLVVAIAADLAHHVWHERKEVVQLA